MTCLVYRVIACGGVVCLGASTYAVELVAVAKPFNRA